MSEGHKKILEECLSKIYKGDRLIPTVAQFHFALEQVLNDVISRYMFAKKTVDELKLTFSQKILLAESFALRKDNHDEWHMLRTLNSIRNSVLHGRSEEKIEKQFDKLLMQTSKALESDDAKEVWSDIKDGEKSMIFSFASVHVLGYLQALDEDSKSLRSLIWNMDRMLNPQQLPFDK